MSKNISPEMEMVKAKRREASRAKWRGRFAKWSWNFVLAEAFLLALHPPAATAALLIATVLTVLHFRTDADFKLRQLPFDVPVALFVFLSGVSIMVSPDKGFSFYNWYNLVGVYVLTYFVVGQNVRSIRQVKELLLVIGMAAVFVLLYGFYQFIFGIDISAMKWVDGDAFPELRKRVFSTWENPNILAGYLDIIICLAFGLFIKAGTKQKRIVLGVLLAAGAACLAMTYARGACLVIAVIFAVYGMLKDWRVLAACVGVAVLLLVADPVLYERLTSVFTKVDTSSEMRLAFWESTVAMIQDHPFLGIGWGAYWMVYPEYDFYLQGADIRIVHAHNMYLNYAAEIGVPGMLAFMWLFFGSLFTALRQKFAAPQPVIPTPTPFDYNEDAAADVELKKVADSVQVEEEKPETPIWQDFIEWPDWRLLAGASAGLGLALISIALNGLTDHLLFNIPSSMFLWLMLAFIAAVAELKREKDAESATEAEKEADATREVPAFLETELKAEELPKVQSEVQPEEQEGEPVSAEKETETETEAEAAPEESTETDGAEAEEIIEKEEAGTDEKSDNHIKGDH
ncbi:O-antigen ligase family protein [Selenomonas ruminantium]|uniref:Putative inorganic carbon (Hco3(-)) transporter n=1 Tax=Selenomonas ruminantium TaxID=971 RepID=A0A1I0WQT7_SELRU|nr:putative inorganic carbon (hco3(-)) transporter [Selenomonas ruminantium]